jgi:hypothetical protein
VIKTKVVIEYVFIDGIELYLKDSQENELKTKIEKVCLKN